MLDGNQTEEIMDLIDESKRSSVHRLLTQAPFVAPVVASFKMSDLGLDEAPVRIYSSNV